METENTIELKNQIFEFKENGIIVKTLKIPFEVLANSKEFIPASGKPQASRPEASWITLQKIVSLLDIRNIVNRIDAIYVSSDEANHPLTTEEKSLYGDDIPIKMWIFNRLIAKITLTLPETEGQGTTASIAYAYNKNGIQIAFGTHVHICSNFTILCGRVFETYGPNKIAYENIMAEVATFIENLPAWQMEEYAMIQSLMNTPIGEEKDVNELIGILLRQAVIANTNGETSALNVTEVSEFVKEIIKTDVNELRNAWELMNVGTQILNFGGKVNLMDAITKHVLWKDAIMAKYHSSPSE